MRGENLKVRRGQRLVLWKRGLNNDGQKRYHEKHQNKKNEQTSFKIDVLKTSRSQRKAGSRQGRSPAFGGMPLYGFFYGNCYPQVNFLKNPKIENGTKIDQWKQYRHKDRLKTFLRRGLERTWKINETLNGKWRSLKTKNMPKLVIYWNRCFCKFSKKSENQCKKGSPKLICWTLLRTTWGG